MTNRHQALRHVWDVAVGPHFLADCMTLPADVQECVVANIAVLASSVCPEAMGTETKTHWLMACEIGRRYRIIYEFKAQYHTLNLFFVRQGGKGDTYDGPLRVVPTMCAVSDDPFAHDAYVYVVERSYECDMEKEDLRFIINKLSNNNVGC